MKMIEWGIDSIGVGKVRDISGIDIRPLFEMFTGGMMYRMHQVSWTIDKYQDNTL
jgi:hypothetical protein